MEETKTRQMSPSVVGKRSVVEGSRVSIISSASLCQSTDTAPNGSSVDWIARRTERLEELLYPSVPSTILVHKTGSFQVRLFCGLTGRLQSRPVEMRDSSCACI